MSEIEYEVDISKLTDREKKILIATQTYPNGICSAQDIAYSLGYRPSKNGILSVTKTLRSLETRQIVGRLAPRDQWSTAKWFITPKTRQIMASIRQEIENNG